jgi:molybdate transport system substrate-binding protein
VLLAADSDAPSRLEAEHLAVAGSRFTYAIGKLVLWSARPGEVDAQGEVLRSGRFSHLAICNPELAPYGAAAVHTLRALGLYERVAPRLVQGESVAQAYQFIASGNAELGFVALSQITSDGRVREGSAWIVPATLYPPIRQDAVLLTSGRDKAAARAFLDWLRQRSAQSIIRSYGYDLPGEGK